MDTQTATQSNQSTTSDELVDELCKAGELTPISIREARKVIGSDAGNITDEELQDMIYNLTAIARSYLRNVPKF